MCLFSQLFERAACHSYQARSVPKAITYIFQIVSKNMKNGRDGFCKKTLHLKGPFVGLKRDIAVSY
jgi:hypothetical protein